MESNVKSKCKKIKLVITDVDRVLTDVGMYYSENGEKFVKNSKSNLYLIINLNEK